MGARLQYAKVIDRETFIMQGGSVHPALENRVVLQSDPGPALAFLVLRAWTDDHGTFTERWQIQGAAGGLVYESTPRELYLATTSHVERLQDEVADVTFEYASDDYQCVFFLDEHEVARVQFPVVAQETAT